MFQPVNWILEQLIPMSFITQIKTTAVAGTVAATIPFTLFGLWKVEKTKRCNSAIINFDDGEHGRLTASRSRKGSSSYAMFDLPRIGDSGGHGSARYSAIESYGHRNIIESRR